MKESCFGYCLHKNWLRTVKFFEHYWMILNKLFRVSIPNKLHVIFEHVPHFIKKHKKPLGEFSEEVVEATHQKFDTVWKCYEVKDVESEVHGENFYRAIVHFNSFNV